MWTAIFATTTIICVVGWLKRYISCAAMIYYIQKNQYKLPDEQDMKECTEFVAKHLLN